ncbi:MAG TPA: hypothetical protein VIM12_17240 [Noviherbaspirillum sp.]|uniref:hypothetical protein n=1 Tax=Noviherbaspirillum sp. TaxID=1926288 RepID=UPI002F92D660
MAATRDEGFAADGSAVFRTTASTDFVAGLLATLAGALALLAGAAAVFLTAGFAIDFAGAGLVAAGAAFFAATVGFADFFIAFAMESIPKDCSRAPSEFSLFWTGLKPVRHSPARHVFPILPLRQKRREIL